MYLSLLLPYYFCYDVIAETVVQKKKVNPKQLTTIYFRLSIAIVLLAPDKVNVDNPVPTRPWLLIWKFIVCRKDVGRL